MNGANRFIGRSGEHWFGYLCGLAHVSCNISSQDDYGWDAFIEFTPDALPGLPADMHPSARSAKVQIKATSIGNRSVSVSLENLRHYAKSSLPVILVLVSLDEQPPRCFARHVWQAEIAEWLERVRLADTQAKPLNHEYATVTFSDEDEHSDDLLPWIKQQIGAVPSPYETTKSAIVAATGFGEVAGIATANLTLEGPDDFLDMQLGLKSGIQLNHFSFRTNRFGILSRDPEIEVEDGEFSILPVGRKGTMRFTFPSGRQYAVAADLYLATEPSGDAARTAWRVRSRCFDVIVGPGERKRFKASPAMNMPLSLRELAVFASLMAQPPEQWVQLAVDFDDREADIGGIRINEPERDELWPWLALWTDMLLSIAGQSDREVPDMSLAMLNEAIPELKMLGDLSAGHMMGCDFTPEPESPQSYAGLLAWTLATIGSQTFGALVRRPISHDVEIEGKRQIGFGLPTIVYGTIDPDREAVRVRLHDRYWSELKAHSGGQELLAFGDVSRWLQGEGPKTLIRDSADE